MPVPIYVCFFAIEVHIPYNTRGELMQFIANIIIFCVVIALSVYVIGFSGIIFLGIMCILFTIANK